MYITTRLKKNDRQHTPIDNFSYTVYSDLVITYQNLYKIIFISFVTDTNTASIISKTYKCEGIIVDDRYEINHKHYKMLIEKFENNMSHIIFKLNENTKDSFGRIIYPIFIKDEKESCCNINKESEIPKIYIDATLNAIKNNTTIPIIDEWGEYITKKLFDLQTFHLCHKETPSELTQCHDYGFILTVVLSINREEIIKSIISDGLKNKEISIEGCNTASKKFLNIRGLDSYQEDFGEILSKNATKTFIPKFNPNIDKVDEKINDFYNICQYYLPGIQSYSVQKNVIQSVINHLKTEKNALISGQTGSGKTIMAIGSAIVSAKKKNYATIVMVPSGLVTRWKEAITNIVPNAIIRIVNNIHEMIKIKKEIQCVMRTSPIWVIISENTAKINYEIRPAVIWNKYKQAYVCPKCGEEIQICHKTGFFGEYANHLENAFDTDFMVQSDDNIICNNIKDKQNQYNFLSGCKNRLWTAASKNNSNKWIKLNNCGWILKERIPALKAKINLFLNNINTDTSNISNNIKNLKIKYNKIIKAINEYETKGSIERYPNHYNIAHYIKKHMKNIFDFGIFDEVHTFAGNSQQGYAFGNICSSVKKAIFLTGTLSNGYASGLFYLLFRTQTKKMLKYGFKHDSLMDFVNHYGVRDFMRIRKGEYVNNNQVFRPTKTYTKTMHKPGINPALYTDFLINNTVTVSKKDIKENLCKYSEIPVAVKMDNELLEAYQNIFTSNSHRQLQQLNKKDIKALILKAMMFLDQPYGLEVYNLETNKILELSPEIIRPKEKKLIELCKKAKENNEKILIYCEYTSRLDISNRLVRILKENDINAINMDSSVNKNIRQSWLEEKVKDGIDAVILNPALIGTGLNLLDYTTIIFYEIGTKLITMRQASQRSNRINQEHPVTVYFMYYDDTVQSSTLALISQKLKAAKAIEGDFSETALQAMSEDTDIMTKLASSIVKNENIKVDISNFDNDFDKINEEDDDDYRLNNDQIKKDIPIFTNRHIINLHYEQTLCDKIA